MRKIAIGIIVVVIVIVGVYAGSTVITNNNSSNIVITYGETTYHNQQYKSAVDDYFNKTISVNNVTVDIINASDVNAISKGISNQTYNSNQIFSSALLDFNKSSDLEVHVDTSKITLVTENMYKSALNSAGITQGYVLVTSPVSATGESALAGIMASYEKATNTSIPNDVKQAANDEIYAQAEVVNNSNNSGNDISNLMDQVKEEASSKNITNSKDIVDLVNKTAKDNNLNLSNSDINNLADAIYKSLSVKDKAIDYKNKITNKGFSIFNIFNF
ncbi:MAG: DUF1002 domain-containing protein [Methanobrevibacter sp.]|nr:DUF1002 domain-containing protein [Methanobrevibacter sp.]